MKKSTCIFHVILILSVTIALASCQKTFLVDNDREYYSGYRYGEKIAQKDAIRHSCNGTIMYPLTSIWLQKKKYAGELKKTKTDNYIKGFLRGYEFSFIDHMDFYGDCNFKRHPLKRDRLF